MKSARSKKAFSSILVNGILALIVFLWLIPVIGILVSSFRERFDIQTTSWWSVLPHREWVQTKTIDPREIGVDANGPMTVEGVTATFEEMRAGIEEGGKRLIWIGNRRIGNIEVQELQWTTKTNLNLENYRQVLLGKSIQIRHSDVRWKLSAGTIFQAHCSTAWQLLFQPRSSRSSLPHLLPTLSHG
jgi:alpha-glucoside transport system permease protein